MNNSSLVKYFSTKSIFYLLGIYFKLERRLQKMEGIVILVIYGIVAFFIGNRYMDGRIPALEGPGIAKAIGKYSISFIVGYFVAALIVIKWIFVALFNFSKM